MKKKQYTLVHPSPEFPPMPPEKRKPFLPRHGYCSIAPANQYIDGLCAAGNGRKIFVYGHPYHDTMVCQHEEFYWTKFQEPLQVPELKHILPEVRRLLLEGKSKEANMLSMIEAEKCGYKGLADGAYPYDYYWTHPACVMHLDTEEDSNTQDYLRTMNYENGEASVYFTDRRGTYARHAFTSVSREIHVQKVETVSGTPLNYTFSVSTDVSEGTHVWENLNSPEGIVSHVERDGLLLMQGCKYDPACMGTEGYAVITRIYAPEGTVTLTDNQYTISNAPWFMILTKTIHYPDFSMDAVRETAGILAETPCDYSALLAENQASLGEMLGRSLLNISDDDERLLSTEELIARQHSSADICPALVEHMYDAGRYFFMTETGHFPPAIGQYNININLQICSGNITGLFEKMKIFFDFIESQFADFRLNAEKIFGCRGIMASIHPNIRNGLMTHFSYTWPHHYWVACAAWIYNEFWNYYLVSGDLDFLRNHIVPGLKEAAAFFEDYLQDKDENGNYIFYPCLSPECCPPGGNWSSVTINACMDIMACQEIMENLITACETLGIEQESCAKWQEILDHLPYYLLDEEGGLKEWAWPGIPEDYNHRCVSHHYALWPGHTVTWEDTPELARAIQISNRKRAQENDSAHGIMHRLFCAIRLKDTADTYHNLKQILEHGFIRRSLLTNHYPYCVYFPDIYGSFPTVMAEMLVYSNLGVIEFLPALPEYLPHGTITGVCCFTFAKVEELEWDLTQKKLRATIVSHRTQDLTLRLRRGYQQLEIDGTVVSKNATEYVHTFSPEKAVQITIHF